MDYRARLEELRAELAGEAAGVSGAVQMLFVTAGGVVLTLWIAAQTHLFPAWVAWALLLPAGFAWTRISRTQRRSSELRRVIAFYERLLARQSRAWTGDPQTGEEYEDADHLYSADLDLFGRGSLFQFLCIARTGTGRDALARYMTELASEPEAKVRGEAIAELRGRTDLREAVAAAGARSLSDCRTQTFVEWVQAPSQRISVLSRVSALILSIGLPILGLLTLIGVLLSRLAF